MTLLLTGALGFTGTQVLLQAAARGLTVRAVVREGRQIPPHLAPLAEWQFGDLAGAGVLRRALEGCEGAVHTVSLGFGLAPHLVEEHTASKMPRAVFFSTTAIFTHLPTASKSVRLAAEDAITSSPLDWTILRPTMIFGLPGDRNMERLLRWLKHIPVFPVFGNGKSLMQPVHVSDVAAAALDALAAPQTVAKAYAIAGAQALPYNELIRQAAAALGRRVWIPHLPLRPALFLLRLAARLRLPSPLKAEQVQRLAENKAFDITPARQDFGYHPLSFAEGIAREAELLA